MTFLTAVACVLDANGIGYALIGAGAMAARGVVRSTGDLDLLSTDARCLTPDLWTPLAAHADIRPGDHDDPLRGVVRIEGPDDRAVDIVVGRFAWQQRAIERAERVMFEGCDLPVVRPPDLILLKLYAGGPQDAWDVEQLLAGPDRAALVSAVETDLPELPPDARVLWERIVSAS